MNTWCAIFDWDGVIVDSSAMHLESWERLAAENGLRLPPDHFRRSFGMKNEQIIPGLLGWTRDPAEIRRLSLRKEELFRERVAEQGIEPLPGVRAFLERLDAAGVPRAIGSSTHRENIDAILSRIGLGGFRALITAHDIVHGKPAPDVFLAAAAALGAEPRACIVFEDAHVGIRAARAAGMKVVGVSTTHPAHTLCDADRVVSRLDELAADELAALAAS